MMHNCTAGEFVYNFECTNTNAFKFWTDDASMSFFSGHALIGAYPAFFLIFYFQLRMRISRFVRSLLQIVLSMIAYFVGISRVFDNRHWITDVIVGGILGILFAIHAWYVQCKNLKLKNTQENQQAESIALNHRLSSF